MLKKFLVILLFPFLVNGQSAFISGDATICDNGISAELVVSFTGTAPFTFSYAIDGVVQPQVLPTQDDVFIISTKIAGVYTLNQFNDALSIGTIDGSALVTVLESPTAVIHLASDTLSTIYPVADFVSHSIGTHLSWDWNFGDNSANSNEENPQHLYPLNVDGLGILGIYEISLIITDNDGCFDTTRKIILVKDEYWLHIPNAFTPDFDGLNDKFCVEFNGIRESTFLFKVFDPIGDVVFQSKNPNDLRCSVNGGWDGSHFLTGEIMPVIDPVSRNSYVFTLYYQDFEGWKHQEFGKILLVR